MSENKTSILKISFSSLNFNEILEEVKKYFENGQEAMVNGKINKVKPLVIFTPNPEIVVYGQKNESFREVVNSAQINIPDGQGIIWASQILGKPLPERISGTDLAEKLVKWAREKGLTVGLIGGGPQIAVRAAECLKEKYPRLSVWADEGPRITMENNKHTSREIGEWARKIREKKTDILFVGFGAPKQEYFIYHLSSIIYHPIILMAVGGAFDYFSGRLGRAPQWWQKIGLEWLFRLLRQPWRLKRQLALLKFIALVFKQKWLSA